MARGVDIDQLEPTTTVEDAVPRLVLMLTPQDLERRGLRWTEVDAELGPMRVAIVRSPSGHIPVALQTYSERPDDGIYLLAAAQVPDDVLASTLAAFGIDWRQAIDPVTGEPRLRDLSLQERILRLLTARSGLTASEIAEALHVKAGGTLYSALRKLLEAGRLEREEDRVRGSRLSRSEGADSWADGASDTSSGRPRAESASKRRPRVRKQAGKGKYTSAVTGRYSSRSSSKASKHRRAAAKDPTED